ncbi:MAG: hypothetical protein GC147_03680 [Porphyrobacter sp.]|nr:hypothetical protein [Porphyrobacter sp.]
MFLELFNEYRLEAQHIASVVLALAIWRRGAAPERWLIGVYLLTMVAPLYVARLLGLGNLVFGPHAWIYIALDVVAAVLFVGIALNANRNYPLAVAGFQLVALGAHGVRELGDAVSPFAYVILAIGPSYCQLLLIFAGFVRHIRRERRFGPYREWRLPSDRLVLFQP